jgi:hypothetical protein
MSNGKYTSARRGAQAGSLNQNLARRLDGAFGCRSVPDDVGCRARAAEDIKKAGLEIIPTPGTRDRKCRHLDEWRQWFVSGDEAVRDMIGMFEQILSRGQVVPTALLMNAMAQLMAAFGDSTSNERKAAERLRAGDVKLGNPS